MLYKVPCCASWQGRLLLHHSRGWAGKYRPPSVKSDSLTRRVRLSVWSAGGLVSTFPCHGAANNLPALVPNRGRAWRGAHHSQVLCKVPSHVALARAVLGTSPPEITVPLASAVPPFVGLARSAANVPDVVVQLGRRQPIPYLSQGSLHDGRQGHPQSAPGMVWHGLGITSCTSSMGWHDLVRRGGPIVANPISPGVARRRRLGPLRAKAAWVPFVRCHPCNEWAAPVVPRCVEPFAVSRVLTAYSSVLPCHALPPPRLALLCNDWIWTAVVPGRMDDGWMDGWMDG